MPALGGAIASAVTPVATTDGGAADHAFALGPDGTVWHSARRDDDSWNGWGSLGGDSSTVPLAIVRKTPLAAALMSVLVLGASDGMLYLKPQERHANGSVTWAPWRSLGGPAEAFAC